MTRPAPHPHPVTLDIVDSRLRAQRIAGSALRSPEAVVAWMGAMQAQEFHAAKWGIGLRAHGISEADVDEAFNAGRILRTHILRPTWHFVAPADIRWMLLVSGPRVHATNAHYYRKTGADASLLKRSRRALERALAGGRALTRVELAMAFAKAGAHAKGQLLAYLMMHAELDGIICSGPRRGKQFTYMLLEERVPKGPSLTREEALAELGRRYFTSHGPATVQDFVWWSGLTVRDAKVMFDLIKPIRVDDSEGRSCWTVDVITGPTRSRPTVDLLPIYDEYVIAYKDRRAIAKLPSESAARAHDPYAHFLMIDGRFAGTWRRADTADAVRVQVTPYRPMVGRQKKALVEAVARFGRFVGRPALASVD